MRRYGRQLTRQSSKPRSHTGCWTCRLRKVKCDEVKPTCGCCTRLGRDCVWGKRWKFYDRTSALQRTYKHLSKVGGPAWHVGTHLTHQRSPAKHMRTKDLDRSSPAEGMTAAETRRRPQRTFNIILTPNSFSPPRFAGVSPGETILTDDPDIVFLHDLGDDNSSVASPGAPTAGELDYIPESPTPCAIMESSIQDDAYYVRHFQTVVARRLIPVDGIEAPEDVIVSLSVICRPLHHAICAISTLTLALQDRTTCLLIESFKHYNQAISACINGGTDSSLPPGASLYIHFILLFFDIYCAAQDFLHEKQVWATHLDQLARLAYQGDPVDEVQAHVLWCALQLDLSLCLAGDTDAGSLLRAYKINERQSPFRYRLRSASRNSTHDTVAYNYCLSIEYLIYNKLADLSQLAAEVRTRLKIGFSNMCDVELRILQFRDQLQRCWQQRMSGFLSLGLNKVEPSLAAKTITLFTTSCIQYSTAMLYLDTSMYPDQRHYTLAFQHADIARHSKQILALASDMIEAGDRQYQLILPIFLARRVNRDTEERDPYQASFHGTKDVCPGPDVSNTEKLLEEILAARYAKQHARTEP